MNMNIQFKLVTLFLVIYQLIFVPGNAQEFPKLTEDLLPEAVRITTRQFGNDGLWGYINGGADLYLEYGFEQVTVQEVQIGKAAYKVDIYRMDSPEAAYGVYSVSRFRCRETNVINHTDCSTPYQYLAAKGNYFLSVSNASGTIAEQQEGLKVAGIILSQITDIDPGFPSIFLDPALEESFAGLKYIKGPIGLQNGYINWDRMFNGLNEFEAWILPFDYQGDKGVLAHITFLQPETQEKFLNQSKLHLSDPKTLEPDENNTLKAFQATDGLIVYEGKLSEPVLKLFANSLL